MTMLFCTCSTARQASGLRGAQASLCYRHARLPWQAWWRQRRGAAAQSGHRQHLGASQAKAHMHNAQPTRCQQSQAAGRAWLQLPLLKRFMPLYPWQGGPPHRKSTWPGVGSSSLVPSPSWPACASACAAHRPGSAQSGGRRGQAQDPAG